MLESFISAFRLQTRDIEVLFELSRSDFATREQLARCCFGGSYEAAKKRLYALIQRGFVSEKRLSHFSRGILRLTEKGSRLLQQGKNITIKAPNPVPESSQFQEPVREHEIDLRDVRAVFIAATQKQPNLELLKFEMSRPATAFSAHCDAHNKIETVRPDAFMAIKETNDSYRDHSFFIEIDRSTESQTHLFHLASLYMEYFRRGGFARKNGKLPLNRGECPMRVLIIFNSERRLANTCQKLLAETRVRTLIWLAAKEDVTRDPLGAIWTCPEDFGAAEENLQKRSLFRKEME